MNNHITRIISAFFIALVFICFSCQRGLNHPCLNPDYDTPPTARVTVAKITGTMDTMFYVDA